MKDLINPAKFRDPAVTARGETRAQVPFDELRTLWVNTGTLCNIECANCYIESSPRNDALVYLTPDDLRPVLAEAQRDPAFEEVGFTGGEPFMNPSMDHLLELALESGRRVLVLTNAMQPMMRPRVQAALRKLNAAHPGRLILRISLDHHSAAEHDAERGAGSHARTLDGMRWLAAEGIEMAVAGRSLRQESDAAARAGYAALFAANGFAIPADDPARLVLFPEMDAQADVPEITTACWGILGKSPSELMCASSRMLVRRKGAGAPALLACTLVTEDPGFELGPTLAAARGPVALHHPHCATFCVLGGASCSG